MPTNPRQNRLIEMIRQTGFATLHELIEQLGVSESTVRRDLNALEKEGEATRTHGGVVYTGSVPKAPHFAGWQQTNLQRKKEIAGAAVELVEPGDTILLDGGSTTYELARQLLGKSLQIITNSLPVANLFASEDSVDLVFIGGVVQTKTGVALGPHATNMLKSVHCRKAFISSAGVTDRGLFNSNMLLVETERAMIECADETILIADSSKFGKTSLVRVCELEQIQRVVTDALLDDQWHQTLRNLKIDLTQAKEGSRT